MRLSVLPGALTVCRLPADAPLPDWALTPPFFSVTRTSEELSVVVPEDAAPPDTVAERGWRALKVEGPLDFALVGILASLTATLAAAGIPLFALSTFDTDYLLVGADRLGAAVAALRAAGHEISGSGDRSDRGV